MFRKAAALIVLGFACALAACDVSGLVPTEDMNFAKRVVAMVKAQDAAGLQSVSDPTLWAQLTDPVRARMASFFPNETETSATVSSWHSNYGNGYSNVEMEMLYKYARQDVQVSIGFRSAGQQYVLMKIYVMPIRGGQAPASPATAPQQPQPYSGDNGKQETPTPQEQQPDDVSPDQDQQSDDKSQSL